MSTFLTIKHQHKVIYNILNIQSVFICLEFRILKIPQHHININNKNNLTSENQHLLIMSISMLKKLQFPNHSLKNYSSKRNIGISGFQSPDNIKMDFKVWNDTTPRVT